MPYITLHTLRIWVSGGTFKAMFVLRKQIQQNRLEVGYRV